MNYYIVTNKRFDDKDFAHGEHHLANLGEPEKCPSCGSIISVLEWLPPYNIELSKINYGDFIFGTYVGPIVSERVKIKCETDNMKGIYRFDKVNLFYNGERIVEQFFLPKIKVFNYHVNFERLTSHGGKRCDHCQRGGAIINRIEGIYFTNPEHIKHDIFYSSSLGQSILIISEKFRRMVDKNGFTNFSCTPTQDFVWGTSKN